MTGEAKLGLPAVKWMFCRSRRPDVVRMNQCPTCSANPYEQCFVISALGREHPDNPSAAIKAGAPHSSRNHSERLVLARFVADVAIAAYRTYVDALHTSYGSQVCSPACEHCDGEKSAWVRHDTLTNRGWVCPICDHALDEMYPEGKESDHAD